MKTPHRFDLHGLPDPFSLLKLGQAFRELACGESLEISYTGEVIPEVLFKVLGEGYEVIDRERSTDPVRFRVEVRKTTAVTLSPPDIDTDDCRCR